MNTPLEKLKKIITESVPENKLICMTKADLYFALKNYCLENMVLLSRKQREYVLIGLAGRMKKAQRKVLREAEKTPIKSFKCLVDIKAYNEADMNEQLDALDNYELEWWCEA